MGEVLLTGYAEIQETLSSFSDFELLRYFTGVPSPSTLWNWKGKDFWTTFFDTEKMPSPKYGDKGIFSTDLFAPEIQNQSVKEIAALVEDSLILIDSSKEESREIFLKEQYVEALAMTAYMKKRIFSLADKINNLYQVADMAGGQQDQEGNVKYQPNFRGALEENFAARAYLNQMMTLYTQISAIELQLKAVAEIAKKKIEQKTLRINPNQNQMQLLKKSSSQSMIFEKEQIIYDHVSAYAVAHTQE